MLWAKLAFICAQAGLTAAVRLPIGEIRTADVAWAAFNRLVAEVCAVAEADGSPVPQAAQDSALALAQAIEPGSFSSLHDDWWPGGAWSWRPCTVSSCGGPRNMLWPCPCQRRYTPSSSPGPSAISGPAPEPVAAPGGTSVSAAAPRRLHPRGHHRLTSGLAAPA